MQAKVMIPVFVAFVVAVAGVSAVTADEFLVCPLVDDKGVNATLLPNVYNCSTFYLCSQGVPELIECPHALHFNRKLNVCDFPWRAACVELPLPEPELPTTEAPPATERIIITQVVKEIIKPVDDQAPSS
ncbi:peritrophin-1 [Dermacentor silvarum]|uniref:peritrophin-1 n=1 Tax=Dermacentor silvarum TaxID=543639 RepID=UPI001897CA93|nr:peritrophin-1 [Dermacentor silvarum]